MRGNRSHQEGAGRHRIVGDLAHIDPTDLGPLVDLTHQGLQSVCRQAAAACAHKRASANEVFSHLLIFQIHSSHFSSPFSYYIDTGYSFSNSPRAFSTYSPPKYRRLVSFLKSINKAI